LHGKIGLQSMPARDYFFKRADFGRLSSGIGCLQEDVHGGMSLRIAYNATRKDLTNLSLLTNYRPNFCSECGDKIVRLHWRVWTSRRFCDRCFSRFRRTHWLQRAFVTIAIALFGILIGRGGKHQSPPLIIQRSAGVATQNQTTAQPPAAPVEQTYRCGARTKKGTPCSRRVHGPVRCWQHKGAKAMLPPEKLLVKE
jgi:hypothetical protein